MESPVARSAHAGDPARLVTAQNRILQFNEKDANSVEINGAVFISTDCSTRRCRKPLFLRRRQRENPDFVLKSGFCNFCFSSKWYHQESNRGHKDFQSFALPTELWHHPDQRSVPYYRGAKVSKFFQPANISRFFSEIILLTQICTSAKTPRKPMDPNEKLLQNSRQGPLPNFSSNGFRPN